jgi:hypothetical protein
MGCGHGYFDPNGQNVSFAMTRRIERGPVERAIVQKLDELRPHLARSALMSARMQLERARIASETLTALCLPALVLNEQGKVLAANSLIKARTGYVQWRAQDRVSLKDRAADQLLRYAIAAIDAAGRTVRSFRVRSARDIFVRCAATLVLTPVTLPQAPPVEQMQSLFDLTPARGALRPKPRLRQNRGRHCHRRRDFTEHNRHACARRVGKDRLQPPSRHCRASHRDFLDAADERV